MWAPSKIGKIYLVVGVHGHVVVTSIGHGQSVESGQGLLGKPVSKKEETLRSQKQSFI
jgi:hypothetical protein